MISANRSLLLAILCSTAIIMANCSSSGDLAVPGSNAESSGSDISYTLETSVEGSGKVEPSDGTYKQDSLVMINALPAKGWVFERWEGLESTSNPAQLKVDSHKNIKAIFVWDKLKRNEAGFYEIEPISYSINQNDKASLALKSSGARIWYSFHAANINPEAKPLFVFLNGGPGAATSTNLFSLNTAPYTLDKDRTGGAPLKLNPHSWTLLGNLLYIDAPNTGFSYNLSDDASSAQARLAEFGAKNFNPLIDAAQIVRVVLRFLKDHPAIRSNKVILVGESYAGTRVSIMLNMLLFPNDYAFGIKSITDESLSRELSEHYKTTLGSSNPALEKISEQFSHQILIQPQIAGAYQAEETGRLFEEKGSLIYRLAEETNSIYCPCNEKTGLAKLTCKPYTNAISFVTAVAKRDTYIISKPSYWSLQFNYTAADNLNKPEVLSKALGVEASGIEGLHPSSRTNAYRNILSGQLNQIKDLITDDDYKALPEGAAAMLAVLAGIDNRPNDTLSLTMGELNSWDEYFINYNLPVWIAYFCNKAVMSGYDIDPESTIYGELFLENLEFARTFITDAALDTIIYSPSIPPSLERYEKLVEQVYINKNQQTGDSSFTVKYKPQSIKNITAGTSRTVFMPSYLESGHSVCLKQPDKILSDVEKWLSD
jgi:hypothetical protein